MGREYSEEDVKAVMVQILTVTTYCGSPCSCLRIRKLETIAKYCGLVGSLLAEFEKNDAFCGSLPPETQTRQCGSLGSVDKIKIGFVARVKKARTTGKITYNGHELHEFCVQRTSAYISQTENNIAELTVRETLDFGARCEGEGFAGNLTELTRLEKENKIRLSLEIDASMKGSEDYDTEDYDDYVEAQDDV
ncbi:hypothetical protein Tco_0895369 [Tanacetum coccineum]|uniref:Uncharacterized protein n=1 Tax=Tanacetum coccineum TaxID=301880 RepID=A0ABQ5CFX9_9ASTR